MNKITHTLALSLNVDSSNRKIYLVFITVFVAFGILNLLEVLRIDSEPQLPNIDVFVEIFIAVLIAFFLLAFTQFFLRNLLKLNKLSVVKWVGWYLIEIILIALTWTVFDLIDHKTERGITLLIIDNFIAILIASVIPYFSVLFTVGIIDKNRGVFKQNSDIIEHNAATSISFADENSIVRLIVKKGNLLFIQSSDNYVDICYLENGKEKKFVLRNTIKKLEEILNFTDIIRCHRSFMVNVNNVITAKKTSSGFLLKIQSCNTEIPVSKSYISEIKKHLHQ